MGPPTSLMRGASVAGPEEAITSASSALTHPRVNLGLWTAGLSQAGEVSRVSRQCAKTARCPSASLRGLSSREAASLPAATLHRGIASLHMTVEWLDRTIRGLRHGRRGVTRSRGEGPRA
jgi:hypothetical protein